MDREFIEEMYRFVNDHFRVGDRVRCRTDEGLYITGTVHCIYDRNSYDYDIYCQLIDVKRDDGRTGGGRDSTWTFIVYNFSREQDYSGCNCTIERLIPEPATEATPEVDSEVSEDQEYICPGCCNTFDDASDLNRECGQCEDCCSNDDHAECGACTTRARRRNANAPIQCHPNDEICSHCGYCTAYPCCECNHCINCGSVGDSYICHDCERCSVCCNNDTCENCNRHLRNCECEERECEPGKPWLANEFKNRKSFNSKRLCGVEWEYNTASRAIMNEFEEKWRAGNHHDGSCGREIVTAPMAGDHIEKCIRSLCKAFQNADAEIDKRCGIHVHVDAKDYTWEDMYRLLEVYCKVEPLLYLFGGQERSLNAYCVPSARKYLEALNHEDKKGAIVTIANYKDRSIADKDNLAHSKGEMKHPEKKSSGRYKGLNISPWLAARKYKRSDQTVEFRIHKNSDNADRVTGWVHLLVRIVDWCAKASNAEVKALPKSSLRALMVIAPESKDWMLKRIAEWRKVTRPSEKCPGSFAGVYRDAIRRVCLYRGNWMLQSDKLSIQKEEERKKYLSEKAEYMAAMRNLIDKKYEVSTTYVGEIYDYEHFRLYPNVDATKHKLAEHRKYSPVKVILIPEYMRFLYDVADNQIRVTKETMIDYITKNYPEICAPWVIADMNSDMQLSLMAGIEKESATCAA